MRVLQIKGVRIGEGRPKTIVPIMEATPMELLASAHRAVAAGTDCIEWRADFLANAHDIEALAYAARALSAALPATPLIATLRTKGQGGRLEADAEEYARLVRTVAEQGCVDIVDIERGAGDAAVRALVEAVHEHDGHAIVSHHDFDGTPATEQMRRVLVEMAALGADIPKLAVMAQRPADAARLMEATACAAEELDTPLLTMSMGQAGVITRLAGASFGSALTFCALESASAPGQVELSQARAVLDALHAACAQKDQPARCTQR
ncbi:MAG: type I 3-dehydroquinate dehydratase [Atopobiaceae bacterium]|nr:type I 3-dehydroquinate dehydratase [Atopobiaceae bacterium]